MTRQEWRLCHPAMIWGLSGHRGHRACWPPARPPLPHACWSLNSTGPSWRGAAPLGAPGARGPKVAKCGAQVVVGGSGPPGSQGTPADEGGTLPAGLVPTAARCSPRPTHPRPPAPLVADDKGGSLTKCRPDLGIAKTGPSPCKDWTGSPASLSALPAAPGRAAVRGHRVDTQSRSSHGPRSQAQASPTLGAVRIPHQGCSNPESGRGGGLGSRRAGSAA